MLALAFYFLLTFFFYKVNIKTLIKKLLIINILKSFII